MVHGLYVSVSTLAGAALVALKGGSVVEAIPLVRPATVLGR